MSNSITAKNTAQPVGFKPRLTARVLRGLLVMTTASPAIDVANGSAALSEIRGIADAKDIEDVKTAIHWIYQMSEYRAAITKARP